MHIGFNLQGEKSGETSIEKERDMHACMMLQAYINIVYVCTAFSTDCMFIIYGRAVCVLKT